VALNAGAEPLPLPDGDVLLASGPLPEPGPDGRVLPGNTAVWLQLS
jgi:alpha-glucosidase